MSIIMGCASFGSSSKDSYLWLEEIESDKSIAWVEAQNKRTTDQLKNNPLYAEVEKEILDILSDENRIPYVNFAGRYVYNFWTDQKNPRGLFRRTTYEDYKKRNPTWEIILDVDQLNVAEGKSWVFRGCRYFKPDSKSCLLFLSNAGTDAVEVREFDLQNKKFIPAPEGFFVPAGKVRLTWAGEDSVLIAADFGPESMSPSGYPLFVKHWKRGNSLAEAPIVHRGQPKDMLVAPLNECNPDHCETFIANYLNIFDSEYYWWKDQKEWVKVDLPAVYEYRGLFKGHFYLSLHKDLTVDGKTFKKGSLLKTPLGQWKNLTEVFTPTERRILEDVDFSRTDMYLTVLDNVNPKVYRNGQPFPAPSLGQTHVAAVDKYSSRTLINFQSPLDPPTLYEWADAKAKAIKSLPARFNSESLKVEQLEAVSADGTKVPYFIIRSKYARGPFPTLVTAYGGFQVSLYPTYQSVLGKVWLSRGGQYVIANIRGGGEFGPAWHEAALKEKRQNAFNDLYAVTEDLYKKGLSPS